MVDSPESASAPRRPWRGIAADERRAHRRQQLVDAGFALMGTGGAGAVTMRGVSREAKLTERYFYESFASREELLVAVLETVAGRARETLGEALDHAPAATDHLVRHVVSVFTDFVTGDPRRGRILFVESLAAPELTNRGSELVEEFTSTIAQTLRNPGLAGANADERDVALNAQAIFGALAYLYQTWLEGRITLPRERFVEHVAQTIESLAQAGSAHTEN